MDEAWSVWRRVWLVVGILSTCAAFVMWHPATVVGTALVGALCGAIVVLLQRQDPQQLGPIPGASTAEPANATAVGNVAGAAGVGSPPRYSVARAALGTALAAVTFGSLGTISLGLLFGVAMLAAFSTPPSLHFWKLRLGGHGPVRRGRGDTIPAQRGTVVPPCLAELRARPAASLTDVELCAAWRRSFGALLDAASPEEKESVVSLRQEYLDEMEVRDAGALEAWLQSGARAAGGPERFLVRRDTEDPPYAA
ncbi:hypothetical protein [Nocardioides mesophilus]|uniref:Uncharacterized protein n=1 Tax=Nocardioides mesophilus TaxID=433659 RepID=A0A7G9RFI4_9ACTN|nr:hypothetical protein [Nocardioides mesophilus]QNN54359.1 hypothetical protein H9L09_08530 [Nocardioides mesophilus]